MALTWNVQPYAYLEELRDEYRSAVTQATRNKATQMAAEAQKWMKANAPWKDQTGEARKGLKAYVMRDRAEGTARKGGLAEARNADKLLLDTLNTARSEKRSKTKQRASDLLHYDSAGEIDFKYRVEPVVNQSSVLPWAFALAMRRYHDKAARKAEDAPFIKEGKKLMKKVKTQKQYKRLKQVPRGRSAVAAFEKKWRGQREPLVDVKFKHEEDLSYTLWLEIANGGRYNIIARATDHWFPKFMYEIQRIARLKQYRDNLAKLNINPPEDSPEKRFAQHVAERNKNDAKPYIPWTPKKRYQRKKRRKYWTEDAKETARENLQFREDKADTMMDGKVVRKYKEPEVERFSSTPYRTR